MFNLVCHYKANICQIPVLSEVSLGLRQKFLCCLSHLCVRGRLQEFRAENGRSGLGGKGKRSEEFEPNLGQVTRSIAITWCDQREGHGGFETLPRVVQSVHLGGQLKSD